MNHVLYSLHILPTQTTSLGGWAYLFLVIPTLIAAGLARVPFKRWFGALFAAECIWTGGLVLAGYYFGYLIQRIETDLRYISVVGAVLIIVLVIFYLAYHRLNLKKDL